MSVTTGGAPTGALHARSPARGRRHSRTHETGHNAQGDWAAHTARPVISKCGDPRACDYLRGVVCSATLPDEPHAAARRSLGQAYAIAADVKPIRDAWSKFTVNRTRPAAITAVAQFGGAQNTKGLLALSHDMARVRTSAGERLTPPDGRPIPA